MKPNIALLAGGYSGESVISYKSAAVIAQNIDRSKWNVYLIKLTKDDWQCEIEGETYPINRHDFTLDLPKGKIKFKVAFIMIHGTPGENGMLQSYFEMLDIPHTTCNAMVANLTFNKYYCNAVVRQCGVHVAPSLHLIRGQHVDIDAIEKDLVFPVFVKPSSGGSSIGMSKVNEMKDLPEAIEKAFHEDNEVLIESYVKGRELTCGVFRYKNKKLVFPVTEIISKKEFFDYEAKYTEGLAEEITPADIPERLKGMVQDQSAELYDKLDCAGVVRFDYIYDGKKLTFLEVNTVPGMSSASIIPQQAKVMGISETQLYDMLLENALERG